MCIQRHPSCKDHRSTLHTGGYPTTLDIEEIFCGPNEGHAHIFAADVSESFDTMDRGILDCPALGRLGLLGWFRV